MSIEVGKNEIAEQPEQEAAEALKGRGFSSLGKMMTEMSVESILRFYRLVSVILSALLFFISPGNFSFSAQLSLIFLLAATSFMMIVLYERFWKNTRLVIAFVSFELLAISLLLAFTGGFHGPFLWYALNPFIVITAFFPFALACFFLALLLTATYIWKLIIYDGILTATEIFGTNFYSAINLAVIVLIIHLFARMHINLTEQSHEKKSQRQELLSAYQNLSSNYEVFRGLSKFQREAVSYKSQKDIYSTLLNALVTIFPFRDTAIMLPPADFDPQYFKEGDGFLFITSDKNEQEIIHQSVLKEIDYRWSELLVRSAKKMVISRTREWIALPLRGEDKNITAIFIGWINPRTNPLSFAENLNLFINFAEQTAEWLSMYKKRERVLQHISSIYQAVETISHQSDPRKVIDIFSSYARALTDCEKTIFWMENTGTEESESYNPIYSVKGPMDYFPEEEWQETLLKAWDEVHSKKMPVTLELPGHEESPARMICVPVLSGRQCLGMLAGIQGNNNHDRGEVEQTLSTLADLGAIAVERTRAEMIAEKLLIVDEQRRIANEIHDNISQNLFSIVYSIDTLSREIDIKLDDVQRSTLNDIKNISAETARELRALIYRLSPGEDANESFSRSVESYLNKLSRMNNVQVNFLVTGSSEYLNPELCRAILRVLKESTGNALRHGQCTEMIVHLDVTASSAVLQVTDNGKGFDIDTNIDLYRAGNRLGLVNMREVTAALNGIINIKSKPGKGTIVTCKLPTATTANI